MTALQQVSSPFMLVPAYGRSYLTAAALLADWNAGKDFRVVGHGFYCSIRNLKEMRAESSSITIHEPRNGFHVVI